MDVERAIRSAVDTGKVLMGESETIKAVINREVKLVILSSNCSPEAKEDVTRFASLYDIPIYRFEGSSLELGAVCGRPHVVSMLGIVRSGDSDIFELGRRR